MIEQTKVEKIIMLFDKYKISKTANNLEKEKSKNNLSNYMLSLDKNEIIDLCALMELGNSGEINDANFKIIKKNCLERYIDTRKEIIINYMITKLPFSQYLKNALVIYPHTGFSF